MKKIVFCILCLLLLCTPQNVYARAGGGGSGGGGGGSGGGGSSSHSGGSGYPHRRTSLLESLLVQGGFFIMAGAGGILFAVHLHKKKRTSARMLKKIDDMDYRWNKEVLDQRVKDVYFAVQQAWSDMDRDTLKELLSEDLYDRWCTKLSFMEISHEKNILKDIELLDLKIVSVNDFKDDTKDFCWYYIKGRMIDYTIDTDSNEYKEGSSIAETFVEYWRFTRRNGIFVLDEVAQKNEKDLTQFTDYSEDLSDQEK